MGYWRPAIGDRFGKLTVVAGEPRRTLKNIEFPCRCDCGGMTYARPSALRKGMIVACSCVHTKHNQSKTPIYKNWKTMNQRCHNPNNKDFQHYGGRGIQVCERWRNDFSAFLEDMGPKPTPLHTIERINNDGNYEPENCCWATMDEQNRNRKRAA